MKIVTLQPKRLAETCVEQTVCDFEPDKAEIGEIHIELGLGSQCQISVSHRFMLWRIALDEMRGAMQGQARVRQRIALISRFADKQGAGRIFVQCAGVFGQ